MTEENSLDLSGEQPDDKELFRVSPIDRQREKIRGRLAFSLVGLLSVVCVFMGFIAYNKGDSGAFEMIKDSIFSPLVVLVTSVVSFYFGAKSK